MALCRLSQSTDPAAKEAVRKGIDIMIPTLARAAASEGGVSGAGQGQSVGPTSSEAAAADSVISKDSATSGPIGSTAGPGATGQMNSPSYARYLKRVLSEDGHLTNTLVHLLQVIVRNRDLFYGSR